MSVYGFQGKYRFLSNFWPAKVHYEGMEYNSVEHAYQAAKTLDKQARLRIRNLRKPGEAKREGQKVEMRGDWEQVKVNVMYFLVREKFSRNSRLKDQLLATKDQYLEETNHWGDTFWGVCKGRGQNMLGQILMEVRDELRK